MLYDYVCKACDFVWEDVSQSIKDKPKSKCPECGKHKLERVIYGGAGAFVKNVNTVGQLADKNRKDMGHYKRSEVDAKAKESKPVSQQESLRREINKMTPKQKQKYIMEGKK